MSRRFYEQWDLGSLTGTFDTYDKLAKRTVISIKTPDTFEHTSEWYTAMDYRNSIEYFVDIRLGDDRIRTSITHSPWLNQELGPDFPHGHDYLWNTTLYHH